MEEMPQNSQLYISRIRTGRRVIVVQCAAVAVILAVFHNVTVWLWWQISLANLTLLLITVFVWRHFCRQKRIAPWVPPLGWAAGVLPILAYCLLEGQGSAWIFLLAVVEFLFFLAVPLAVSLVLAVILSVRFSRQGTDARSDRWLEEEG